MNAMKKLSVKIISLLLITCVLVSCFLVSCNKEPEDTHVDYAAAAVFDPAATDTVKQKVTVKSYIDGDTTHFFVPTSISETGVLKARYLGINTPESTGQIQEYGKKASNFTKEKLMSATEIYIESDDTNWNLDSTGARYLVWVWYKPEGSDSYRNLNIELMQEGLSIQSNSAQNRYGESCVAAYNQARDEKLNIHSGQKDPDFYYGETVELTLKELRCNIESYIGVTVAFEAVVTKNSGSNGVYVEAYDAETDMYNGMYVYYGTSPSPFIRDILSIGTRLRVAGKVGEFGGSYQISDVSFSAYRPSSKDLQKLDEDFHPASYTVTDAATFVSGKVDVIGEEEVVQYDYAALALNSSICFENLRVVSYYTTTNPQSSSYGAFTLYCEAADGTEITVRTAVLRDEAGNLISASDYAGKTITVKGIVDFYDPDSGESSEGFNYQIKVLATGDITINN